MAKTLKASLEGKAKIKKAREQLTSTTGWAIDNEQWLEEASQFLPPIKTKDKMLPGSTSIGTWKRFLAGKAIKAPTFKAFCRVLELDWEEVVEKNVAPSTEISKKSVYSVNKDSKKNNLLNLYQDWEQAPDVNSFYGRAKELNLLEKWIIHERCKLVGIVGLGGIGKTDLSVKFGKGGIGKTDLSVQFARDAQSHFDYIIWRSLLNAPLIEDILFGVIGVLSNQIDASLPRQAELQLPRLFELLKEYRCLLILDNFESILENAESYSSYRKGYEIYGELLKRFYSLPHQSCAILTSRETPAELDSAQVSNAKAHLLQLSGLNKSDIKKIFSDIGDFSATEFEWENLVDLYGGNPLAIKLVAKYIQIIFQYNVSDFLQEEQLSFGDIENLLEWHFSRLSTEEKEIMYWLAINREPLSRSDLREALLFSQSKRKVTPNIYSLFERFLLEEAGNGGFTLQPVLMEYVTNSLIQKVYSELSNNELELFNSHSLFKSQSKDYLRAIQNRLILQPIFEQMVDFLGDSDSLQAHLIDILKAIKVSHFRRGYAAGNLLNIFCQFFPELDGLDFSSLKIRQAYLQDTALKNYNFSDADFDGAVFIQALGEIMVINFSPDGHLLVSGDRNYDVSIWNVETGKPQAVLSGHTEWVRAVLFHPLKKNLVISGGDDDAVKIWNQSNKQCIKTLHPDISSIMAMSICSRGQTLACVGDEGKISIWDINEFKNLIVWQGYPQGTRIWSAALSPDGRFLVSGAEDCTVKLWDVKSGECLHVFTGHTAAIRAVSFDYDQEIIASGSDDTSIKIWDVSTGKCLRTLTLHSLPISSIQFSPRSKNEILSSSADETIRRWNLQTGECLKTFIGHQASIKSISFSPNGHSFASGGGPTIKLWNVGISEPVKTIKGSSNDLWAIAINPTGEQLISSWQRGKMLLWDIKQRILITTIEGHTSRVTLVAFSPDSKYFASASYDHTIKIWDAVDHEWLVTLAGHRGRVRSVSFVQDGYLLASGSDDGTVRLWDRKTGECICVLEGHSGSRVWSIASSPDGKTIASGDDRGNIVFWDITSKEVIGSIKGHDNWIRAIEFSPDGRHIVCGSNDKTATIWDIKSCKSIVSFSDHLAPVYSVSLSSDGQILATGSDTLRLWDITTQEHFKTLHGHELGVISVRFSHQSHILASGSVDSTVKLWKGKNTYDCIATLRAPRPYDGMNITGATGLLPYEVETLKRLGAIEF